MSRGPGSRDHVCSPRLRGTCLRTPDEMGKRPRRRGWRVPAPISEGCMNEVSGDLPLGAWVTGLLGQLCEALLAPC